MRTVVAITSLACAVIALAPQGASQVRAGQGIFVVVADQTGAVIPEVRLTIEESSQRRVANGTTDGDGRFQIALPPGDYTITLDARHFLGQTQKVRVLSNTVTDLRVSMELAEKYTIVYTGGHDLIRDDSQGAPLHTAFAALSTEHTFSGPSAHSGAKTEDQIQSNPTRQKLYEKWPDEDARWIITDNEQSEYLKLKTDRQRDAFIEAFWERRNPEPGSSENWFKEEHYRRIAYANIHFAAAAPGWKTDRGHIYIVYGPPDAIDFTSDGSRPSQTWRYRSESRAFHFVDSCGCGDYELVEGPSHGPQTPKN
jgi:GWxTD domain-containing protein